MEDVKIVRCQVKRTRLTHLGPDPVGGLLVIMRKKFDP